MGQFDDGKQQLKGDIQGVYRYFVRLRVLTGEAMHNAKNTTTVNPEQLINGVPQEEAEFTDYLARLFDYYKYKFEKRNDVELPDFAVTEDGDLDEGLEVRDLSFGEAESLYHCIAKLQEKLGHLSVARGQYTEEGI